MNHITPTNLKLQASNRAGKNRGAKKFQSLALALSLMLAPLAVYAATDIPFVVTSYNKATTSPATSKVIGTVTIKTLSETNGPRLLVAKGTLYQQGDLLVGVLPMTIDTPEAAAQGTHKLNFNVSKSGRIGLQWMLNDHPREGRPMRYFETQANGNSLAETINWQEQKREITVSLAQKLTFAPGPVVILKPTPKPTLVFHPMPLPKKKVAYGRLYYVSARMVVTNSDDGFNDDEVELAGYVRFKGSPILSFDKKPASSGDAFTSRKQVILDEYGKNYMAYIPLDGIIADYDKTMNSDTMWITNQRLNLLDIANSNKEYLIKGDNKSESADVYIRVDKGEEVFH